MEGLNSVCGICGYVSNEPLAPEVLEAMNNTMVHRGPDDSGIVTNEQNGYYFGLAHRRLSIIDLSELGHQPMFSVDKNIALVFNGEIYNYLEIKKELLSKGHKFISKTDTEVIIAAYLEWGTRCLNRFNGMFALAIHDRRDGRLLLARDRVGKKPLYYYHKGNTIIFASELKSIMKHPAFVKEVRIDIIARYLYQQYIAAPDTIFHNTYKLESGTYLIWENNSISVHKYWSLIDQYYRLSSDLVKDYDEAKYELTRILRDSIEKRMIADVPLGTFLSGGIDSSLVTAIAQDISSEPIKTYSIGFEDPQYDESRHAQAVAEHLGTKHTNLQIDTADMLNLVDSIPQYYDEPFADSSQISTMLVAQLAKQDVTVVLSGDGGDEPFCGYDIYDRMPIAQKLDVLGEIIYKLMVGTIGISKLNSINIPLRLRAIIMNRNPSTKTQLYYYKNIKQDLTKRLIKGQSVEPLLPMEDGFQLQNWQMRKMLLDMLTYLPEDILTKVDRATMRCSLEARAPLLDYRFVEYSFRLPHTYKCCKGEKKYILKDIAYDYIPKSKLDRPKQGFAVPIQTWLKNALKEQLSHYSNQNTIEKQGIFNYSTLCGVLDAFRSQGLNTEVVWSFFVFQMWYDHYIAAV